MKKYFFISLIAVLFISGWISLSLADTQTPRGKSAAASLLPDELKSMKVEDYFVESKTAPVGSIQSVTGHVVVIHKDTNRAYFAATGDAIYQQDVFYTLKDSRCRIKFSTEDIITMGGDSKVIADEIVDDQAAQKKSSVISMLKGKAMFYVVRLFKYKTVSASVKTPTAVMGVRGTKFGVDVRKVGEKVADLSDNSFIYLAQNESGNLETVVYGFEGEVEVNSTGDGSTNTVGTGETLVVDNLGSGDVEPTDPNAANQFIGETEGGAGTGGTAGADAGTVEGGLTGDTGDTSESIAQTLTGLANDQITGPVNRMGYFTAMLTYIDWYGDKYHWGTFMSNSLQDFLNPDDPSGNVAYDSDGSGMWVNRNSSKLTSVKAVEGEYPVTFTGLGHNAYMEWGYWTLVAPIDLGDGSFYNVDNRGYYLSGDNTSDIDMASLQSLDAWWLYSGGAEGTYWTSGDGANMTGLFEAKVNFMTQEIGGFNLAVAGGGHNASVAGASGSFDGTSHFGLIGGTSNIGITGAETSGDFNASGSFYGPAAQSMGGVWSISGDSENATGIFHGDKQVSPVSPPPPSELVVVSGPA